MTTETAMPATLGTDTLRELRAADSYVSFHAEWTDGELTRSEIVGSRRVPATSGALHEDYTSLVFPLASVFDFGGVIVRQNAVVRAFAGVSTPRFSDTWRTVVALLRKDDALTLLWSANGWRNGYAKDAGLNVDHLTLRVDRGKRRYVFDIAHSVCPSNTARMFTGANHWGIVGPDLT